MFKKLKDKLAEEVKSSPQRIQQIAQAAQAAVTSASSSITDITNSDLFSIGDNDSSQNSQATISPNKTPNKQQNMFQDVSLLQSTSDAMDYTHELDQQRQRRLSNSSFASDVSFRLPSYETPSMYHLQSDMEVSASEADERGFSGGPATLDRVTKEQLYAAYKRTQERYTKYRTQYSNLARHYKLLERENAKARSVLVETQDKALRRISELKEQCALEQSAKAHLEKALRVEIEEKNMKIETLNTKIQLLQNDSTSSDVNIKNNDIEKPVIDKESEVQLINLTSDNQTEEDSASEVIALNNKIEKMEQLLNKYKESLKSTKEKNSQITAELQKVSNELECRNKEIESLKILDDQLNEAKKQIQQLNDDKEDLQNQINAFDFNKTRELSTLELDLQKANEEIAELQKKIDVFHKREEEYAISLAENKLSIHKELESKEAEIKSLKDSLATSKKEIQSLHIVITDYKNNIFTLEEEKLKLSNEYAEYKSFKTKCIDMDSQLQELLKKCQALEQSKTKADEEYNCLQLQLKQETAEKLAMIDRNTYLESRNTQLSDDVSKKNTQISNLENELKKHLSNKSKEDDAENNEKAQLVQEATLWKEKCSKLESEIQDERVELGKLQEEIEKLLANHELLQNQNAEFRVTIANLTSENAKLSEKVDKSKMGSIGDLRNIANDLKLLRDSLSETSNTTRSLVMTSNECFSTFTKDITEFVNKSINNLEVQVSNITAKYNKLSKDYKQLEVELDTNNNKNLDILRESDKIREKNIKLTEEYNTASQKIAELTRDYELSLNELNILKNEMKSISTLSQEVQIALKKEKDLHSQTLQQLKAMQLEKVEMQLKLEEAEKDNVLLKQQYDDLKQDYECINKRISELQSEVANKSNEVLKYKSIQESLEQEIAQYALNNEKLLGSECDKQTLDTEIRDLKNQNQQLVEELKDLRDLQKVSDETITRLNSDIATRTKDIGDKLLHIRELEENIQTLSQENVRLKNETTNFVNNISLLESEIDDIKKSHAEIEIEKDRLNNIIETLEKESHKVVVSKDSQTDLKSNENVPTNESTMFENKWVLENKQSTMTNTASLNLTNTALKDIQEKYNHLKASNDALKDENRRLQSDIEGLQSYLTKISKENSILNDKLRESIANSEHSADDSVDVKELRNELKINLEKVNDLLRENSLLVEENLELKDQLQFQNYPKAKEVEQASVTNNNDKSDIEIINKKYDNLMQVNSQLQKRNMDLEEINKSVSGNISQLQDKNERLKLSNEKLERRLDEALVSLRHLHSLQENTELEYLRNILYEYLTGSGTHSVTLAKVLSAIVKFDDSQTQLVLQKEKERQGFLRQLGII